MVSFCFGWYFLLLPRHSFDKVMTRLMASRPWDGLISSDKKKDD